MSEFLPLNRIIVELFEKKNWDKGIEILKIKKAWKRCVGDFIASQAHPVKISGKTLFVGVRNSLLMAELKLNQMAILGKIKNTANVELKEIKFFIHKEKISRPKKAAVPRLPSQEAERLKEEISRMKDPEIRNILMKTIEFLEEEE